MCGNGQVPGPFFFDDNMTGNSYLEIVNHRIIVRHRVDRVFQNRVVAVFRDNEWPPRSPDLTACDFFLGDTARLSLFRPSAKLKPT